MKIHNLSGILNIPFIALAAIIIYLYIYVSQDYGAYILVPTIGLAMVYIFKAEIDQKWWQKNPPQLDSKMKNWLNSYSSFYNQLEAEDTQRFEDIMSFYMETKQFYIVSKEAKTVPYDIKGIVIHEAVKIIMKLSLDPFNDIERIVLYKHAFPTPQNKFLHTVETHIEDKVLIFSLEHLVPGLINSNNYYNISMHGYIDYMLQKELLQILPNIENPSLEVLEKISDLNTSTVEATVGIKPLNIKVVTINYYFTYPENFKVFLPLISEQLDTIFAK